MNEVGDWSEYQRLVMSKLESLEAGQRRTEEKVTKIATEQEVQKVKAGLWGALAGAIPTGLLMLYNMFFRKE